MDPKRFHEKAYQDELSFFPQHLAPDAIPFEEEENIPIRVIKQAGKGGVVVRPILTIVVSFSNIQQIFNDSSVASLMFSGGSSVADYFQETSYNQLDLSVANETYGTVNDGIIDVNVGYDHPNFGSGSTGRAQLVADSFSAADPYIDYSAYDTNGNGSVTADEACALF